MSYRTAPRGIPESLINARKQLRGMAVALVAAAILIVAALWIATWHTVSTEHQRRLNENVTRVEELVSTLERHAVHVIGYGDTYLRAARLAYSRNQSLDDLSAFLRDVPPNPAILSHITVIDAEGTPLFLSNGQTIKPGVSAADRPYFILQKAATGDMMYISPPLRGRNSGLLTIRLVRCLTDPDGAFAGVIFAAIPVAPLTEDFASHNLGAHGTVGLVGLDGKPRAWQTGNSIVPDEVLTATPIWAALDGAARGIISETRFDDRHVLAYRRLADYPLVANVALARVDFERDVRYFTWWAYSVAALASLVVALFVAWVLRDQLLLARLRREVGERRRAEEIKSTFLTTMSHEIRTPINAILGLFELIERAEIPDRQRRQARAGQTAATDLYKQLSNVLDASRLEAKSLDLTIRPEPVRPMLTELRDMLEAAISTSGKPIVTETEIGDEVPDTAPMDRRRVEQIVLNFIDNAVKFTDKGTITLRVSARQTVGGCDINWTVADTGLGIAPEYLERAFDRFAQLEAATARRARGTGLGLAISKELAELMHGRIEVDSTEGKGSAFSLILTID